MDTDRAMFCFRDNSLFSSVMDYLSIEKGWFSPYLFASGRRPVIPRSVKPDIVFCHGPFLSGTSLPPSSIPSIDEVVPPSIATNNFIFCNVYASHIFTQATTGSAKPCSRNPHK